MKFPANRNLGRKLARKYQQTGCTIQRKTMAGWIVIATNVPCLVEDTSDRPPRPDPYDAGSDNIRTWNISFRLGQDVRMRDQLHDIVLTTGEVLPVLTVATEFQTETDSTKWVVAHAEDSAVMKEPVTFFREHEDESTTTHGPFMMTVDWEDVAGTDPDNYAALAHFTSAILTGEAGVDVHHLDWAEIPDDKRIGRVIEVRKPIAGRQEFRCRFDTGGRD